MIKGERRLVRTQKLGSPKLKFMNFATLEGFSTSQSDQMTMI